MNRALSWLRLRYHLWRMAATPTDVHRETLEFVYQLEGDVDAIDVFQLAPTLLSLGKLIQDSNQILNPGEKVSVNVRPFRPGSFTVDVLLWVQDPHLQQLAMAGLVASAATGKSILDVLKAIGLIADVKNSAIEVIRRLRGTPKAVESVGPGQFRYSADDNTSITVDSSVHQVLQNSSVVQNIQNVYVQPLSSPKVTGVRSFLPGDEQGSEVRLTKDDVPLMNSFVAGSPDAKPPVTRTSIVTLKPSRGSFEGEAGNWSFRWGDTKLRVTIRDQGFLDRVRAGVIRLHSTDLLRVDLQETEAVRGGEVHVTREILNVIDYMPGARQVDLPFPLETRPRTG